MTACGPTPGKYFDLVLTNPPFGKKSSLTFVDTQGEFQKDTLVVERDNFWATTSNKQLNFLQHVRTLLKNHGRAAIVVPDNVLFEGGAGETVRRKLLAECDVHTLLRLPTGIFYAPGGQGQRAVLRLQASQRKRPGPSTCGFTTCAPTSASPLKTNPACPLPLGRLRGLLQLRQPAGAHGDGAVPPLQATTTW